MDKCTAPINSKPKRSRHFGKSCTLWATFLFLLLNVHLNLRDSQEPFSPVEAAARSFDYTGIEKGPLFLTHEPNVLLLGSSLLIHPEWKVDRSLPTQDFWAKATIKSVSSYHLAQGLEKRLSEHGVKDAHVYSLAAGGALISDSYLLLSHYLEHHAKPNVVVIDCAPRSFNDTGVTKPTSTVIFKHCFAPKDFFKIPHLYLKKFDERVNHLCERTCFVYHHRQWLSNLFTTQLVSLESIISTDWKKLKEQQPAEQIVASNSENLKTLYAATVTSVTQPSQQTAPQAAFKTAASLDSSLAEYKGRYRFANRYALQEQMHFLQHLARLCESRQIKLIVLNMPLHERNLGLLPAGFYEEFQTVVSAALDKRAIFKNLANLDIWSNEDYDDCVHLNEKGGAKLNTIIAQAVGELTE